MTKSIAITNQKGGVGKTTTVHNLGAALANKGFKTLLVDLDAQGNLTNSCGLSRAEEGVFDVLDKGESPEGHIYPVVDNLYIIPTNIRLAEADLKFASKIGREVLLKKALSELTSYDYMIFDCPPNFGVMTINAMVAADSLLIPVQAEYHAMAGVSLIENSYDNVRNYINENLNVLGILITLFDKRKTLNRDVFNSLRREFGEVLFETVISDNVKLAEAPSYNQDIFTYAPHSKGARDYSQLANEVLRRIG